jgi:hypothetical protein
MCRREGGPPCVPSVEFSLAPLPYISFYLRCACPAVLLLYTCTTSIALIRARAPLTTHRWRLAPFDATLMGTNLRTQPRPNTRRFLPTKLKTLVRASSYSCLSLCLPSPRVSLFVLPSVSPHYVCSLLHSILDGGHGLRANGGSCYFVHPHVLFVVGGRRGAQ